MGSGLPALRVLLLLPRQEPYRNRSRELTIGLGHPSTFEMGKKSHQAGVGSRGHPWACSAHLVLPEVGLCSRGREVVGEKERPGVRAPGGMSSPGSQELL